MLPEAACQSAKLASSILNTTVASKLHLHQIFAAVISATRPDAKTALGFVSLHGGKPTASQDQAHVQQTSSHMARLHLVWLIHTCKEMRLSVRPMKLTKRT